MYVGPPTRTRLVKEAHDSSLYLLDNGMAMFADSGRAASLRAYWLACVGGWLIAHGRNVT